MSQGLYAAARYTNFLFKTKKSKVFNRRQFFGSWGTPKLFWVPAKTTLPGLEPWTIRDIPSMRNFNLPNFKAIFLVSLTVFSNGLFAQTSQARPLGPISPGEMRARLARLQHLPLHSAPLIKLIDDTTYCVRSEVTLMVEDPSLTGPPRLQTMIMTLPNAGKPTPFMIILPTIEGITPLEHQVATKLCQADIASIIADVNHFDIPVNLPAWGDEDLNNRWAVYTISTILDFAESHPKILKNKMGMIGLSLGAITSALMAGIEDRLQAVVIVAGAGNMPAILSYSDESHVVDLRQQRMQAAGFTTDLQYENQLRDSILFDPIYFSPRVKKENIWMMRVTNDLKVPFENQVELWNAFHQPLHEDFTLGHVGSIIELTYLYMTDVLDFLGNRFGL